MAGSDASPQGPDELRRLPPFPGVLPGDEDLSGILKHLEPIYSRGRTQQGRASDPVVRWLLEAGIEALVEQYCNFSDGGQEGYLPANDFMGSISMQSVMTHFKRLVTRHGIDPGASNKHRIVNRWRTTSAYQRDLICYIFRPGFHAARMHLIRESLPNLMQGSFGELVEALAIAETDEVQTNGVLQLQLVLMSAFPRDPEIRQQSARVYRKQAEEWAAIYAQVGDHYGLQPRESSGVTWLDLAHIFNVVVEGAYLRRTAAVELGTTSAGEHVSVKMIQLLLAQVTGRSWEELATLRP